MDLQKLFEEYQKIEELLKPMLDKQQDLKTKIKEELILKNVDSLSCGKVTATKCSMTRVSYDSKQLEKIFTQEELKPARKETTSTGVKITISNK